MVLPIRQGLCPPSRGTAALLRGRAVQRAQRGAGAERRPGTALCSAVRRGAKLSALTRPRCPSALTRGLALLWRGVFEVHYDV